MKKIIVLALISLSIQSLIAMNSQTSYKKSTSKKEARFKKQSKNGYSNGSRYRSGQYKRNKLSPREVEQTRGKFITKKLPSEIKTNFCTQTPTQRNKKPYIPTYED